MISLQMTLLTLKIQINSKLTESSNHGFESADGEKKDKFKLKNQI